MKKLILVGICCIIGGGYVFGADLSSVARGKELFASKALGTNGRSCATCHPDGKNLQEVGSFSDEEMAITVNACITGPLEGSALARDSAEMKSLILYLKGFAGNR
jgi:cytochrome c